MTLPVTRLNPSPSPSAVHPVPESSGPMEADSLALASNVQDDQTLSPRAKGDRELTALYRDALPNYAGNPNLRLEQLPKDSTLGQWREHLRNLLESPSFQEWADDVGIDRSKPFSIFPPVNGRPGMISCSVKDTEQGHLVSLPGKSAHMTWKTGVTRNVQRMLPDDRNTKLPACWAQLMQAAKVLQYSPSRPFVWNPAGAPVRLDEVAAFYGQTLPLTKEGLAEHAAQLEQHASLANTHVSAERLENRSQDALDLEQQRLADTNNRQLLASSLLNILERNRNTGLDAKYLGDEQLQARVVALLENTQMKIDPASTYFLEHELDPESAVSLKEFIENNGWLMPKNKDELNNLATFLKRAPLPVAPYGNFAGALSWPLDVEDQKRIYSHVSYNNLNLPGLENPGVQDKRRGALGYLTKNVHWDDRQLSHPAGVINDILQSPRALELEKALQKKIGAGADERSRDYTLAAIALTLDWEGMQTPNNNQVAGFDLAAGAHFAKTLGSIKQQFVEHLISTGKASAQIAPIAAHLLLSRTAPELLIKGVPGTITYGSNSWVNLRSAVNRIETLSPGASSMMSFVQIMDYANVDPVTSEALAVRDASVNEALLRWGEINAVLEKKHSHSIEDLALVKTKFKQQVDELSNATEALMAPMPTRRQIAHEKLKKTFGNDGTYEKKYLQSKNSDHDANHFYSPIDVYMSNELRYGRWESINSKLPYATFEKQSLPSPKMLLESAFNAYHKNLTDGYKSVLKSMFSRLPEEDRKHLEHGKQEFYYLRKAITDNPPELIEPYAVEQGKGRTGILIRSEHENDVRYYEVFPSQMLVRKRTDLPSTLITGGVTSAVVANREKNLAHKLDWDAYRFAKLPGDESTLSQLQVRSITPAKPWVAPGVDGETGPGQPMSYFGQKTEYLAEIAASQHFAPDYELAKSGAMGESELEKTTRQLTAGREFLLSLVPFKSAIESAIAGKGDEAVMHFIMDGLSFIAPGAKVVGRAGKVTGSVALKSMKIAKILGMGVLTAANPLDGVVDTLGSLARGGLRAASATGRSVNRLRGAADSYDLIAASKRFDASARGTFKRHDQIVEGAAVLKSGKWYAFDTTSMRAFGKPLNDFHPSVRANPEELTSWQNITRNLTPHSMEIRGKWHELVGNTKNGPTKPAFERGYSGGDPNLIPGYSPNMKSEQLMVLAQSKKLAPEEIGALARQAERLAVQHAFKGTKRFQSDISAAGGVFIPAPQTFYLSQVKPLSQGQCAALSRAMASAMAQGKELTLIENMFTAAANPTHPATRVFSSTLSSIQKQISTPTMFHAGKPFRQMGYKDITSELATANASKTLMIESPGHAMVAGVKIDGGKKVFFFYDPNYGVAKFSNPKMMDEALDTLFNNKKLPVQYRTYSADTRKLEFKVSVHDENWAPIASVHDKTVKDMFDAPIITTPGPKRTVTPASTGAPIKTPRMHSPVAVVPKKTEVLMTQSATVTDQSSILSTRSLSDCTAIAVLTDLKDGIYGTRTLMHLQGGVPDEKLYQVLRGLDKSLADGGKVIFVGGDLTYSNVGLGAVLGQIDHGEKVLLNIVKKHPASTTIATAVGIDINPDGTFKLIEGQRPVTELSLARKKEVLDWAESD